MIFEFWLLDVIKYRRFVDDHRKTVLYQMAEMMIIQGQPHHICIPIWRLRPTYTLVSWVKWMF